jgi:hypothetical protein
LSCYPENSFGFFYDFLIFNVSHWWSIYWCAFLRRASKFPGLYLWLLHPKCIQTAQEWSLEGPLQSFYFLCRSEIQDGATAGHILTLDHIAKCLNAFFSETTNMIKAKLYMNVHWMVLYKLGFLFRYEIQNGGYVRT